MPIDPPPATGTIQAVDYYSSNVWILYTIGAAFAVARVIVKYYLQRRLGVEEYLMIVALLCWTADTTLISVVISHGTNQLQNENHRKLLKPEEIKAREIGSKSFVSAWFMYITALWACKYSIVFFYNKLMSRVAHQRATMVARYVLGATWLACIICVVTVCRPFKRNWQVVPNPGQKCTSGLLYVWVVETLNIATDMMLLVLPMPLLVGLQVSPRRKIMLVLLFGLSAFVIVATILRIYFSVSGGSIANVTFWSEIETAVLFIVANAPGIKPVFSKMKKKVSSRLHQSRSYEMSSGRKREAVAGKLGTVGTVTHVVSPSAGSREQLWDPEMGGGAASNMNMYIVKNLTVDIKVEHEEDLPDTLGKERFAQRQNAYSVHAEATHTSEENGGPVGSFTYAASDDSFSK